MEAQDCRSHGTGQWRRTTARRSSKYLVSCTRKERDVVDTNGQRLTAEGQLTVDEGRRSALDDPGKRASREE